MFDGPDPYLPSSKPREDRDRSSVSFDAYSRHAPKQDYFNYGAGGAAMSTSFHRGADSSNISARKRPLDEDIS